MSQKQRVLVPFLLLLLLVAGSQRAFADVPSLVYTGSSGNLAATAEFSLTGNTLTVTLTNTSLADVLVPTDVLTGVFFNTTNILTPISAALNGSIVYYGNVVNNVGEGWAFNSGISAHGENSGISATGLGLFGPNGNFFAPGVKSNGLDYGILSAGDNTATGNPGVTKHGPLVKNSIQFTLTAASGFSLSQLGSNVVFQYGTDLTEPSFNGTVPEPSSMLSLIVMLSALGAGVLIKYRRSV